MINFIITAFKSDSDFLVSYQEQIQYILVDEFQDSNNSQVQLLSLLSSYFDRPNLFVVGDDDQSIFRFQGASVQNLYDFYQKYQVKPIILTQNYRSHQLVLDASKSLIDKSSQSLSKLISNIDKNLTAQPDLATSPIKLFKCPNPISEAQYISSQIKALMDRGVSANSIAVLYRHHKDTQYLTKFLNVQKIKFNQSKTNCLLEDHLNFFIRLLKAISDPFNNTNLYSALSLPISGISSQRLIRLIFKLRRDNADLSTYLFSQKIKSKTISSFVKKISDCRVGQENINLDSLFIYIINTFSYLDYLSGLSNNFTAISDLNALFSYLKTFIDNNPQAQLKDFVARLDLLLQYNLSIPQIELTPPQDCLNLLTIHGAKGLEFDHVFVLNCLAKNWENYRFPQKLSLPDGIVNKISQSDQIEEERRLFFVALTRAKKQIYLSYSNSDLNQKSQTPSQFILDIDQKYINAQTISTQLSISDLAINLSPDRIDLPDQNRHYLTTYLKNHYKFNISHLNSYLRCPHCFYFKNILKIPLVKNDSLVFGTAVHASLAHLHKNHQADLNKAIDIFQNSLKNHKFDNNKYDYYLEKGQKAIKNYFDHGFDPKAEYKSEVDFGMENIHIDAVPVTGKIDKIQILTTSTNTKTNILISDFKTGKPDNISAKLKPGFDSYHGNYFRQILFYQLLLDLSPRYKNYHLKTAQLEFLEPKKNGQYLPPQIISYTKPDLEKLKQLISQVYQNILELKFPINYTCRDPDHLHHLT